MDVYTLGDNFATPDILMFSAFVFLPLACLIGGISLLIYGFIRKRKQLPCTQAVVAGLILILLLVAVLAFFFVSGMLGMSPTPS